MAGKVIPGGCEATGGGHLNKLLIYNIAARMWHNVHISQDNLHYSTIIYHYSDIVANNLTNMGLLSC